MGKEKIKTTTIAISDESRNGLKAIQEELEKEVKNRVTVDDVIKMLISSHYDVNEAVNEIKLKNIIDKMLNPSIEKLKDIVDSCIIDDDNDDIPVS